MLMKNSIVVAVAVMLSGLSQASIIYQDAFNDGTVGSTLNTTLDISTNGATWKGASGAYDYTGSGSVKLNTPVWRTVYLEFSPEAGKVYTYSANVRVDAKTASEIPFGVGFISQNNLGVANPAIMNWWNNADSPWIRIDPQTASGTPGYPAGVAGAQVANTQVGNIMGSVGNFNNYQIVLDTTAANWTATYLFNGSEFYSYTYSGGNPTISAFGFGSNGSSSIVGEMDSVELSVIPEPATLGLIGFVSVGILCIRRLRLV